MERTPKKTVLVGVLKKREDLRILLRKKWYRIPVAFLPRRMFTHIAFYQPLRFGKRGKRIEYVARVAHREVKKRAVLLPRERSHPHAEDDYLKCSFRTIKKLDSPVRNIIPRRVSFGFTDFATLRSARDILELYHIAPTEQIVEKRLARLGIPVISQYVVATPLQGGDMRGSGSSPFFLKESGKKKRYRLDFAVFCKTGALAIECDNRKAHSSKLQKHKDVQKNAALKRSGWRIIRLTEDDILYNLNRSISRIQKAVLRLGGILPLRS